MIFKSDEIVKISKKEEEDKNRKMNKLAKFNQNEMKI